MKKHTDKYENPSLGGCIGIVLLLVLPVFTACHRRVVTETVMRTVVVHDTVEVEARHLLSPLQQAIVDALAPYDTFMMRSQLAYSFVDLGSGEWLARKDGGQRMRTASVMKAVTAITALSMHSQPDSVFATSLLTDGKRLWVRGGWDPLLSEADVTRLAKSAKACRGVASGITGMSASCPVGIDMSGQDMKQYGKGWCWDDNNPLLTPLFYGPATQMRKKSPIDHPEKDFTEAFCRAYRKVKAADGRSLSDFLADSGVVDVVYRPFDDVLKPMLKESDNLMAEAVWRTTGNTAGERQKALRLVAQQAGVETDEYVQADGSGLSLYNYFSPDALTKMMVWADRQPWASRFRDALPCMGVDGTLKKRRVHGAKVQAKTGTVNSVITLAGYMTLLSGRRIAFAVMCQGIASGNEARAVIDRILETVSVSLQEGIGKNE